MALLAPDELLYIVIGLILAVSMAKFVKQLLKPIGSDIPIRHATDSSMEIAIIGFYNNVIWLIRDLVATPTSPVLVVCNVLVYCEHLIIALRTYNAQVLKYRVMVLDYITFLCVTYILVKTIDTKDPFGPTGLAVNTGMHILKVKDLVYIIRQGQVGEKISLRTACFDLSLAVLWCFLGWITKDDVLFISNVVGAAFSVFEISVSLVLD